MPPQANKPGGGQNTAVLATLLFVVVTLLVVFGGGFSTHGRAAAHLWHAVPPAPPPPTPAQLQAERAAQEAAQLVQEQQEKLQAQHDKLKQQQEQARKEGDALSKERTQLEKEREQLETERKGIADLQASVKAKQEELEKQKAELANSRQQQQQQQPAPAPAPAPGALAAELPALRALHDKLRASPTPAQALRAVALATLRAASSGGAAAAKAVVGRGAATSALQQAEELVARVFLIADATGFLIPCLQDSTLKLNDPMPPQPAATAGPTGGNGSRAGGGSSKGGGGGDGGGGGGAGAPPRIFIQGNIKNNHDVMPHIVVQLLRLVLELPVDTAYVSIYESGSTDDTDTWLDVLELALTALGVPNRIVTRGAAVRREGEERITFLARVRNLAMAPLYEHYSRREDPAWPLALDALTWSPDYILVISDTWVCWGDMLRLINHRADIACGLDFMQFPWDGKNYTVVEQLPPGLSLERPIPNWHHPRAQELFVFYDRWVARDLGGTSFHGDPQYAWDPESAEAVKAGRPFKAFCCWNGLLAFSAEPFRRGLRFRDFFEGECRAAEPTLLCNDFHRLGFGSVVVDPNVRQVYSGSFDTARQGIAAGIKDMPRQTWAQTKEAGVAGAARTPAYANIECCIIRPGKNHVDFGNDCSREDIMAVNWTEKALPKGTARAPAGG